MPIYFLRDVQTRITQNKNHILLGIFAFLALSIAFTAGYITARDLTITPIVIQQNQSR